MHGMTGPIQRLPVDTDGLHARGMWVPAAVGHFCTLHLCFGIGGNLFTSPHACLNLNLTYIEYELS